MLVGLRSHTKGQPLLIAQMHHISKAYEITALSNDLSVSLLYMKMETASKQKSEILSNSITSEAAY